MANYKTQAITLKSYNLGEADKIIVMYSREYGIIKGVAKGVKKATSKLGGSMQALMANDLMMAKGRNLDIVCQAQNIDSFCKIKNDLTKLSYACYCAELIMVFGTDHDPNSAEIYDMFFETLKNIAVFSTKEEIIWAVVRFKLNLAMHLGYGIELDNCVKCTSSDNGKQTYHYFCPESGGVVCTECATNTNKIFKIDSRHIKIMKDATNFDFPFEKEHNNKMVLSSNFTILKEFISQRADKKLKTPEMIEILS